MHWIPAWFDLLRWDGEMQDLEKFYDQDYHDNVHGNLFADDEYFWARAKIFNKLYFKGDE